jgi:carbon monoxide dehydrogenase subunit G
MDKTFQTDIPADKVWNFISDPNKVVVCVPGAKITEQVNETSYKGTVSVKIGPVANNFKGQINIERLDHDNRELALSGQGMDTKGTGRAEMKMKTSVKALESGKTEVASSMELNVSGKIAQFGTRMIGDVNNQMFSLFTKNLEQNLQSQDAPAEGNSDESAHAAKSKSMPPEPQPVRALPLLFLVLKNSILRFFRRLTGKPAD